MGMFDFLFGNSRQEQGQDLYGKQLNDIRNSKSEFDGINDIGTLDKKFGLSPFDVTNYNRQVDTSFAPGRANLATGRARALSASANRMGGRSANPESIFNPIEGAYAGAEGQLEGEAGNARLQGFDKQRQSQDEQARMLEEILGQKQGFGERKRGAMAGGINSYLQTQSPTSLFDDLISGVGTATKFATVH